MDLREFQNMDLDLDWPEHWLTLKVLLVPIKWNWSSSVSSRRNLVAEKRHEVCLIKPFTNGVARSLVDQWLEEEKHSGLWD